MHLDPLLPRLVGSLLFIVALTLTLRRWGTPSIVVYLLAGIALGADGVALLDDRVALGRIGEFGVLLLLFFVGMEMSLPRLLRGWRVAVGGTVLQILVSVAAALVIGAVLGWPLGRSVLLGFVLSLSSTAVVVRLLQDRGETHTVMGQDVLGVLLAQDLAIVPMLMILGALAGGSVHLGLLGAQALVGGGAVVALLAVRSRPELLQRGVDRLGEDRELRFFVALLFCLGLATLSALAGLSTASGAFLAGLLLSVGGRTEWAHHALDGLRILLLAVFFAAVGALLDMGFVMENAGTIVVLAAIAFGSNTVINAMILRGLGRPWPHALRGGAWLSQIGELSFVLAAVGLHSGLIGAFAHSMTVSVIACTLVFSTAWIGAAAPLERWALGALGLSGSDEELSASSEPRSSSPSSPASGE